MVVVLVLYCPTTRITDTCSNVQTTVLFCHQSMAVARGITFQSYCPTTISLARCVCVYVADDRARFTYTMKPRHAIAL